MEREGTTHKLKRIVQFVFGIYVNLNLKRREVLQNLSNKKSLVYLNYSTTISD